jgi:4-hydroxybenzoate polyprenyltransferase
MIDKFYNKFYVGVLSIITGFLATLFDDFLGFLMGLFLLIGGIYAVTISKRPIWLKGIVLGLTTLLLLFKFNVISF